MFRIFSTFRKIFYTVVVIIGVHANLLGIVILSREKCGLSTCTTRYLMAMAMADLSVVIFEVLVYYVIYYYFSVSFLDITPVCSVNAVLRTAAKGCSVWFTVTFTFDRFMAICCQKQKKSYRTGKTAAVVLTTTGILICLQNIPMFFAQEPGAIIDSFPWECYTKQSVFTAPGWVGFNWFHTVVTPLLPFFLAILFNALTVRHILVATRVRKGLRGQINGENHRDPEVESRRKSIFLLFSISGNFIFLWFVNIMDFFYYNIKGTEYSYSEYIFQQVGYMLMNLSCCTNRFIYGVTQSKFREQVKNMLTYPVASIISLVGKSNNPG